MPYRSMIVFLMVDFYAIRQKQLEKIGFFHQVPVISTVRFFRIVEQTLHFQKVVFLGQTNIAEDFGYPLKLL